MLPNGTDLGVYKAHGLVGLNYAVVGGAARYHTPRDDFDHADPWSLQHHGDNALAVVRALADAEESMVATGNLVGPDEPVAPPTLEVVSSEVRGAGRHVTMKLHSSRGASVVGFAVPSSAHPRSLRMEGQPLVPNAFLDAPWQWFECVTTPTQGIEVELTLDAPSPFAAYVYDETPGLQGTEPSKLGDARPSYAVPYQNGDLTVAARRVDF